MLFAQVFALDKGIVVDPYQHEDLLDYKAYAKKYFYLALSCRSFTPNVLAPICKEYAVFFLLPL